MEIFKPKNKQELAPEVDFTSEHLEIELTLYNEAAENLPKISPEDILNEHERACVLLGDIEVVGRNQVKINIKAVLEQSEGEGLYLEHVREVYFDFPKIRQMVSDVKNHYPEFSDLDFIGDLHTHPIKQKEEEHHFRPSSGDIEAIKAGYESNLLNKNSPYIFMIAAPDENSDTTYTFWRMVKIGSELQAVIIGGGKSD